MKVYAPPNISDITLDGQNVTVTADGIDVTDDVAAGLIKSFGFTKVPFAAKVKAEAPAPVPPAQPAAPTPPPAATEPPKPDAPHAQPRTVGEDVSDAGAGEKVPAPQQQQQPQRSGPQRGR